MLPELEGTEFICLLKKNGGKTNADGTFTPYFNVYGWNFTIPSASVLEIKTGNKTTYPPLNMGATINLDYDKLLRKLNRINSEHRHRRSSSKPADIQDRRSSSDSNVLNREHGQGIKV